MVVLYWSECAILFLNEEERGCEGRLGGSNAARFQVLVQELVKLFLFVSVQGVHLAVQGGLSIGDELDGVVPRLSFG